MTCEAKLRPRYRDTHWTCTGDDLINLMDGPQGIPVVAPSWARDALMAGSYRPEPFTGGDHYHIVLPGVNSQPTVSYPRMTADD